MAGLKEVIERKGVFCALYSDRGSHFWLTPKAGGKIDPHRLTQVGRALRELGVQMIPAYSPQARGRSERSFGTWQGRLPQKLRIGGAHTLGGGQSVSGRALQRSVQCSISSTGAVRPRICAPLQSRSGSDFRPAVRTHREPRQHGQPPESAPAD